MFLLYLNLRSLSLKTLCLVGQCLGGHLQVHTLGDKGELLTLLRAGILALLVCEGAFLPQHQEELLVTCK